MSVYLEKFILPTREVEEDISWQKYYDNGLFLDNDYPCGFFTNRKMMDGELISKDLSEIDFENVTIIYGGNGSGKTTLLNIMANKLNLNRLAPYNSSELFDLFVEQCKFKMAEDDYGRAMKLPMHSAIITSDDVFDYMLFARVNNNEIGKSVSIEGDEYARLKDAGRTNSKIQLRGLENFEEFKKQNYAWRKTKTRHQFIQKYAGKEVKLNSNGETAIDFFAQTLKDDTLYCMDEPENSLSPKMQLKLKEVLERKSRYCGCQFIIATHSPFILAINNAKIYNLDATPVTLNKWWEVENTKTYFDFFFNNKDLFLKKK